MTTVAFTHFIYCQVCRRMRSGMTRIRNSENKLLLLSRGIRQNVLIKILILIGSERAKKICVQRFLRREKGTALLRTFCHRNFANKRKPEYSCERDWCPDSGFCTCPLPCPQHPVSCQKKSSFFCEILCRPAVVPVGKLWYNDGK